MSSFCAYFNQRQCRSCSWIELGAQTQIARKSSRVRDELAFLFEASHGPEAQGLIEAPALSPERGFRDRAKMTVTGTMAEPLIGLSGQELLECPIHHPKLNELLQATPGFISGAGLEPYRIAERRGELKGIIAFHSPRSGQAYLRFVLRSRESVARIRGVVPALQARFPGLVVVTANIQPIPHAILEGPEEIFLTDRRTLDHRLGDLTLQLAPQAFVQTNSEVATDLYRTAARWVREAGSGAGVGVSGGPAANRAASAHRLKMLELFCGQGAFSFFAADAANEILGIEIQEMAVQTANETATALALKHLTFRCLDVTRIAGEIDGEVAAFAPDLVLVNPPRRGLGKSLSVIERAKPRHLIYSSCAIETLASDLKALAADYQLRRLRMFDMFPHTEHFETLVWLERRG